MTVPDPTSQIADVAPDPSGPGRRRIVIVAITVFLTLSAALTTRHEDPAARPALAPDRAKAAALRIEAVREALHGRRVTGTQITAIDRALTRVTFRDGRRTIVEAALAPDGSARDVQVYSRGRAYAGGNPLANAPLAWVLLSLVFVAYGVARPMRSTRTADVAALLAVLASVALYNDADPGSSALVGVPPVLYLAIRCLWVATRPRAAEAPGSPLTLTGRVSPRLMLAALVVLTCLVTWMSATTVDVGYASVAGATLLLDGRLPYGNMPADIIHGDTYPILLYLLYVPAAMLWPMTDSFDPPTGALVMSAAGAIATGALLAFAGGSRAAILWLAFPITLIGAASGSNDTLLAATIAAAVAALAARSRADSLASSRAVATSLAIIAGTWIKVAPVLAIPMAIRIWRGRAAVAAIVAMASVTALALAVAAMLGNGIGGINDMADAVRFQSQRGTLKSFWQQSGLPWLQAPAQALAITAALVAACAARWMARQSDASLRLAAALASCLAFAQVAATFWTPLYVLWVVPAAIVALLPGTRDRHDTAP